MANVIIFTDNPPSNTGPVGKPRIIKRQTRTAGAYAIASCLRRQGYSVLVVDHCSSYTFAGVKKVIDDNSKDLLWVGISTTFFTTKSPNLLEYKQRWMDSTNLYFEDNFSELYGTDQITRTSNITKLGTELIWGSTEINAIAEHCENYQAPFLIGGAWVTHLENGNLRNIRENVYIIRGRAENVVRKITDDLFKSRDSKIVTICNNDSFDDVEFKTSSYIWEESDNVQSNEWLPLEIARGCAFNCAYCSYDRRADINSYRDPESIRNELISNFERYGVTRYVIMDDLYNDTKHKVRRLYDEVWSKLPFKPEWVAYTRLDMIYADPESADILRDSGIRIGSFGIETLHDLAGKKVGKGLGKKRILDTLKLVKESWGNEALIQAFLIMGLPGEPESSLLETVEWVRTTDLIDAVLALPLWITPPTHQSFVSIINAIAKDNEKYKISWLNETTWVNQQGVTFTRAAEIANLANALLPVMTFAEYTEFRCSGLTHEEITNIVHSSETDIYDTVNNDVISDTVLFRVKKTLGLI